MKFRWCFSLALIIFFGLSAQAQSGQFRGVVQNKKTGTVMPNVAIVLASNFDTTIYNALSDINGFYSFDVKTQGDYTLYAVAQGFDTLVLDIKIKDKVLTRTLYMSDEAVRTDNVNITGKQMQKQTNVRIGHNTIDQRALKSLVTIGGEPDLVQSLQILPGVVTTGDQGGQLYIRGGSPVMNKVLLDGVTIYNPFHSIGLFSVFDSDIIRSADVYSAGFGAQYGGRISAVVDVSTREGNKTKFSGKLSTNPFTSKILLEGPIMKFHEDKGSISYILSYKNSYLDKSSKIFYSYVPENSLPFSFNDLYGKVSFNGVTGSKFETFGFNFSDKVRYPNSTQFNWDSRGGGIRFLAIPGDSKTIFDGFVSYSDYKMTQTEQNALPRESSISGFNIGLNFTYLLGRNDIKYGFETNGFKTNFTTYNTGGRKIEQIDNNTEISFFIRHKKIYKRFVFEPGFRLQYYASLQEFSPEPRFATKYNVNSKFRITAAAGMYSQNLMSATSDRDVVNLFYGFLASPENLPAQYRGNDVNSHLQKSRHYIVGTEIDVTKRVEVLIEAYQKDFNQITNINRDKIFDDNAKNANQPDILKKDFIIEKGKASGIDFRVKYETKKIYLWAVYSFTYITRADEIREYFPSFDRRHNANVMASYIFGKGNTWEVGGRFAFGSGFPFTKQKGFYELNDFSGGIGTDYTTNNGNLGILYDNINEGRLPVFNRFDVSLKKKIVFSKTSELNIILSVVNVYNRANIFYFDRVTNARINQLPFLPSLGANFSF